MPCTFIRLSGCPLRCSYCDTLQAQPADSGSRMAVDEIIRHVDGRRRPLVLVTGGEPLMQRNCIPLLEGLLLLDCEVQLETSGAYSIADVPEGIRRILDVKTPDSGESGRNHVDNFELLGRGDEIKFVICSRNDYEWSREFVEQYALERAGVPLLFSPAWGSVAPQDLSRWILEDRLPVRLHLQMHKIIWGAEAMGV